MKDNLKEPTLDEMLDDFEERFAAALLKRQENLGLNPEEFAALMNDVNAAKTVECTMDAVVDPVVDAWSRCIVAALEETVPSVSAEGS